MPRRASKGGVPFTSTHPATRRTSRRTLLLWEPSEHRKAAGEVVKTTPNRAFGALMREAYGFVSPADGSNPHWRAEKRGSQSPYRFVPLGECSPRVLAPALRSEAIHIGSFRSPWRESSLATRKAEFAVALSVRSDWRVFAARSRGARQTGIPYRFVPTGRCRQTSHRGAEGDPYRFVPRRSHTEHGRTVMSRRSNAIHLPMSARRTLPASAARRSSSDAAILPTDEPQ